MNLNHLIETIKTSERAKDREGEMHRIIEHNVDGAKKENLLTITLYNLHNLN